MKYIYKTSFSKIHRFGRLSYSYAYDLKTTSRLFCERCLIFEIFTFVQGFRRRISCYLSLHHKTVFYIAYKVNNLQNFNSA